MPHFPGWRGVFMFYRTKIFSKLPREYWWHGLAVTRLPFPTNIPLPPPPCTLLWIFRSHYFFAQLGLHSSIIFMTPRASRAVFVRTLWLEERPSNYWLRGGALFSHSPSISLFNLLKLFKFYYLIFPFRWSRQESFLITQGAIKMN